MVIHERYAWSMHEKSTLRKHLEAWRAKPFVESDFGKGGFDVRKLLGAPCMLSIIHNVTNDRTYANISGIAKLAKGLNVGELVNDKVFVSLDPDEFDRAAFATLPDSLKTTIMASPEYRRLFSNGGDQSRGEAPLDDQIPF